MATVIYSLSVKNNQSEENEIIVRFRHASNGRGIDMQARSGIFVRKDYFKDGKVYLSSRRLLNKENDSLKKKLEQTRDKLNDLEKFITDSFKQTGTEKKELPKNWLKDTIHDFNYPKPTEEELRKAEEEANKPLSFFEALETYMKVKRFSEIRRRHYQVLYRILKRYQLFKKKELTFENITADTLRDFETFLKEEHKYYEEAVKIKEANGKKNVKTYLDIIKEVPLSRTPDKRGENAVSDIMRRFRAFVRWANGLDKDFKLEKPITTNNPFSVYSVREEVYGTPYYITIEERNKLFYTKLPEPLATQRDIFVFQCNIGCRVSDLWAMTKNSIINGAVEYIPRKTKEGNPITVRVPLNKYAIEIINRHKDHEGESLFPFTSQQQYNIDIKSIFKEAGLTRLVTTLNPQTREEEKRPLNEVASSHMARRTFVGNLYKKVKDPNAIGELSGHAEGSKAFKRYRSIDEETKVEFVTMLE